MEVWLGLSFLPVDEMVATAVAAEEAGFAGVTVSDHLVWPGRVESAYPYSPDARPAWRADADWPDAWVLAAAVLQACPRLRLATNVYLPALRDPHVVAKAVGTAAVLSGGRVVLGVGAGWLAEEFTAVGREFRGRGAALDESLAVIRALWSGDPVALTPEQQAVDGVTMRPRPAAPVPVWVGGTSSRALRRAAANDGWVGVLGSDPTVTAAQAAEVRGLHAAGAGDAGSESGERPPFTVAVAGYTEDPGLLRELADAGVDVFFLAPAKLVRPSLPERREAIASYAERVLARS